MNWGVKIFLTFGVCVMGFVLVGIYMVTKDTDTLEHDDYYERGINYDEVYDRRQNLQRQRAKPKLSLHADTLLIRFTAEGNSGQVYLKRASDSSRDEKIPFSVAGDVLHLPLDSLLRGMWEVDIEWKSGPHAFQYVETIYLDNP